MKIKFFKGEDTEKLEGEVNNFTSDKKIINISTHVMGDEILVSVLHG